MQVTQEKPEVTDGHSSFAGNVAVFRVCYFSCPKRGNHRSDMRRRLLIVAFLMGVAAATTWPLATRLDRSIPRGKESSATVPVFNLWTVGWNLNRASHGWQNYWDAPHFFPTRSTLALSEPLAATQLMSGVRWLPPPAAYNLFLLSCLVLNAGMTWLVLHQRRMSWPVTLFASLVMARLPFVHWQIGSLQCVLVAGIMGTIHFADEALRTGRISKFLLAAACFDLTFLTCGYYALFLLLVSPMGGGVMLWQRRHELVGLATKHQSQLLWRLFGAVLVLSAIVPLAVVQSNVLSDPFFERRRDLIQELSALPTDYLEAPFAEWFQFLGFSRWHEAGSWKLSPGFFKVALATFGLSVGICHRRRRAWTLIWFALSASAFVGSLGLNLQIAGWSPYATLLDWMPSFSRMRTPARMAVMVQIGVVFLAAEALNWGFRRARIVARSSVRSRAILAHGLVWVAGLTACFEVPLPEQSFIEVPSVDTQRGWIDWLNQNTPRDTVIAHLPFPRGPLPRDYESEAWAMYWGLFHQRRMVNGYSGFFPASYLELKSQLQSFPDDASFAALGSRGVSYCIVRQSFVDQQKLADHSEAIKHWELAFQDETAGVAIFRLRE